MPKNYGHKVFYKCFRFWVKRTFTFYCLTDPDLKPVLECPPNFIECFIRVMRRYPEVSKVGFSLKIDDIPDEYFRKNDVINWEEQFYRNKIKRLDNFTCELYSADIDTTFALTTPSIFVPNLKHSFSGIRVGAPYQLRHLPWYVTVPNEETRYFSKTKKDGSSNWVIE